MSEIVKFQSGNESSLQSEDINNGIVRVAKDTKSLFFDIDGSRIEITDFISVSDLDTLNNILAPISKKFYFVESECLLYKYINGVWKAVSVSINDFINNNNILLDIEITIPAVSNNYVICDSGFYIDIDVETIRATDNPIISLSSSISDITLFDLITSVETYDKKVRVYISTKPTTDIKIILHSVQNRTF